MTKEWQEATNEYLRVCDCHEYLAHSFRVNAEDAFLSRTLLTVHLQSERVNPIYGISSEGYKGKGHVQSKSAKSQGIKIEEDE